MRGRGIIGVKTDERSKKTSGNDGSRDSKAKDKERDREKARDRKLRGKEKERQREKEMERERAKEKENKSRQIEENKNAAKERASHLSKIFEEQVLHGLDKVMGGGAVVLTLKDQNILSDGDLNEGINTYAKADEASKSLRLEQTPQTKEEEEESLVFADDDEDLYKALERTRKQALKKQEAEASGPQAIALLATSTLCSQIADDQNPEIGTDNEDVFMDEDELPRASDEEQKDGAGGWMEVQDSGKDENPVNEDKENMDKKKSKLVGIIGNDAVSKMRSERFSYASGYKLAEETSVMALYNCGMTLKEALCMISHKLKGPGKMKQYQEELKLKQMKNSDAPSLSVERMREAQAQQTSDPRSGFATVDKDLPGGLTPMLGDKKTPGRLDYSCVKERFNFDKKVVRSGSSLYVERLVQNGCRWVEHFLGIKQRLETENSSAHQRSLKFEVSLKFFRWRTHGSKRDSENMRAHYSVSSTLKGTHSDGYGYFSICFGTV
ncbi:hypothetical protein POTOM_014134 [Populus tomentosa]|uniref:Uncharacterized protein n=1 Tax=Populus tomentosa TaxID=118781 RepID=A0A8X8A1F5_POPTO|nr:hypothetical protein POTOM_014134 [Populus tomentosa]